MPQRLEGKVAIVTGGAGAIGRTSAATLARHGAKIVVADINADGAEKVADSIRATGGEAVAVRADVGSEAEVRAMAAAAKQAFGRVDVLYNNAALLGEEGKRDQDVASMESEVWDRVMAINLRGPMLCSKHVIPMMVAQGGGSIIFASSGMGVQGEVSRSAYAASKAGLIMLSKSIAAQYGLRGVRSNAIQIGYIPDKSGAKTTPAALQKIISSNNLTPYEGNPQFIADVVLFLASDESAFVTGHTLAADGGFSSHTPSMAAMAEYFAQAGHQTLG